MGWGKGFWGKKKIITVNTSAMHLADASVDPFIGMLINAILDNKSIPSEILRMMLNGLGVRIRPAVEWAKIHYPLGVPQGTTTTFPVVTEEEVALFVIDKFDLNEDDGVQINYYTYTVLTPMLAIYVDFVAQRRFKINQNTIEIFPEGVTFPPICTNYAQDENTGESYCIRYTQSVEHRMTVKSMDLSEDGMFVKIEYNLHTLDKTVIKSCPHEDCSAPEDYDYSARYTWYMDEENTFIEMFPIADAEDRQWDAPCYFIAFQRLNSAGYPSSVEETWIYMASEGTYPDLGPVTELNELDTYLPVFVIRYENVDYSDESRSGTVLWQTTRRLMRHLLLDFEAIGDEINANPDIDEIDHVYVMFGADLQSEISETMWYLGKYFHNVYGQQETSKIDYLKQITPVSQGGGGGETNQPMHSFNTNRREPFEPDTSFIEHGLNLEVSYGFVTSEIYIGQIYPGDRRKSRIGRAKKTIEKYVTAHQGDYCQAHLSGDAQDPNDHSRCTYHVDRAKLIIDMQIGKRTIRRITVVGLATYNDIYKNHGIRTELLDVLYDSDNHNLIVPIQYETSQSMQLWRRNMMLVDSNLVVVNVYDERTQEWWETTLFKFMVMVVVMIIAAYTFQYWLIGLVGLIGLTAMAILIKLVAMLVIAYLLTMLMNWIVDEYGAKIGIIGAILLTVVAMIVSKGSNGFMVMEMFMITGQLIMQAAMVLISSVNEFLVAEGEAIKNEYIEFEEEIEERWEDLQLANDLLDMKSDIDPMKYVRPARLRTVPSESPDHFYQRCIELPENSMYTVHSQIPHFITNHLRLHREVPTYLYNQNIVA